MGAGSSFDDHVRHEFGSLVQGGSRDYVVLHELQQLSNASVDFSHLGTLFVLNASRTGRVPLVELLSFVELCRQQHRLHAPHEFKARLQAFCSLQMWRFATQGDAQHDATVTWFVHLLTEAALVKQKEDGEKDHGGVEWATDAAEAHARRQRGCVTAETVDAGDAAGSGAASGNGTAPVSMATPAPGALAAENIDAAASRAGPGPANAAADTTSNTPAASNAVVYAGLDAVELLHRLFHIQRTHAIDFQTFLDMMQQVGEEMGLMDLDDQRYDYVVPLDVLRKFAADLLNGALQLIAELLIGSDESGARVPGRATVQAPAQCELQSKQIGAR